MIISSIRYTHATCTRLLSSFVCFQGEFEPDIPPDVARPLAEKTWSQKFRTYKHSLRQFLKKNAHNQVEPKGIDPNIWKKFIESEEDPRKKELNNKNKRNREKLDFSHCLGRRTYAQKEYLIVCFLY